MIANERSLARKRTSAETRERIASDDYLEWLSRAKSSLLLSQSRDPAVYLEDLCFHAHEAAERAIKAVFIHRRERFPYTHDLKTLLTVLLGNGAKIPKPVIASGEFSVFKQELLYPSDNPPVSPSQHRRSRRIAAGVVEWAERQVLDSKKRSRRKP